MDTSNTGKSHPKHDSLEEKSAHIREAATDLLNEGKKMANELYAEGVHKVCETQDTVKEYSDDLLEKVKENPLASVLIAGGIGFLLSALLKK